MRPIVVVLSFMCFVFLWEVSNLKDSTVLWAIAFYLMVMVAEKDSTK